MTIKNPKKTMTQCTVQPKVEFRIHGKHIKLYARKKWVCLISRLFEVLYFVTQTIHPKAYHKTS